MGVPILPTINASLNALAAMFLFLGWLSIRKKNALKHRNFMIAALITSALFLITYLTYHAIVPGPTRYQKEGFLRVIYFFVLLTHTPLAAIIMPLCFISVYHALKGNFEKHKKFTKWLWPMWMYVSVTGVVIYLMLYIF